MAENSQIIKSDLTSEDQIKDAINALKEVVKERLLENKVQIRAKLMQAEQLLNAATSTSSVSFQNETGGVAVTSPRSYTLDIDKEKRGQQLYKVYELLNECITIITDRPPIQYAIYYERDGKLYRRTLDTLEGYVYYSKTNDAIRIKRAELLKVIQQEDSFMEALSKHYKDFSDIIYNCQRVHNVSITRVNKGHVSEAFEHHFQESDSHSLTEEAYSFNHAWDINKIWQYVSDAVNNRPWYTGGDVGQVQVKNITKGTVRLSTVNSLWNILKLLETTIGAVDEEALNRYLYTIIKTLFAKEDLNIADYSNELDQTINNIFNDLIGNKKITIKF